MTAGDVLTYDIKGNLFRRRGNMGNHGAEKNTKERNAKERNTKGQNAKGQNAKEINTKERNTNEQDRGNHNWKESSTKDSKHRLVIDGNTIYEIDLECLKKKERENSRGEKRSENRYSGKEKK